MLNRRRLLAAAVSIGTAVAAPAVLAAASPGFVTASPQGFRRDGRPYRFAGANLWYGAWLGAETESRARLARELDALAALGVTNLRIMGSAEDSPLKNSVKPAFRTRDSYNEALLSGLDVLMAEIGRRGMTAVICLTNFWEWSGGMMTYLLWTNGGRYLDMNDPAHPWPAFPDFNAAFYSSAEAQALYRDHVRAVVGRTNGVTGVRYADDPAILAWQLANEPRPGGSVAVALPNLPAFHGWIADTARLIKTLDPNHMVSTGSEGLKGCIEREACVLDAHASPDIDYLTAHIWPQNWSWVDAADLPATMAEGQRQVADYIDTHLRLAARLGKPLVIEEFGFPRDDGYDPGSATLFRDRCYGQIFAAVEASAAADGALTGSNFWAWGGEARAAEADHRFRLEAPAFMGDPPHEPQGWYSVFDADRSTQALVRAHAARLNGLDGA